MRLTREAWPWLSGLYVWRDETGEVVACGYADFFRRTA